MDIAADGIFYGVTFLPTTLHAMKCSNPSIQNLWIAITSSLWMDDGDDNLMLPLLPRCVRERFCQWHAIYAWAALCVSRNEAHTRYRNLQYCVQTFREPLRSIQTIRCPGALNQLCDKHCVQLGILEAFLFATSC